MIQSRADLRAYLEADDLQFQGMDLGVMAWLAHDENLLIRRYKHHMRRAEYYRNVHVAVVGRWFYRWHLLQYLRLGARLHYSIKLNTCGPGLSLYHTGARIAVKHGTTLGAGCTLLEGVVFGKKTGEGLEPQTVGDNCYFGTGAKILGQLTIGNGVTVGANSVVTHSLPDHAVAAGAPARVLRIAEE